MHLSIPRFILASAALFAIARPVNADVTPSVSGSSGPPVFQVGTSSTDPNPYYQQLAFDVIPVGKTVVLPIVVSGSGPMSYTATSSSPALAPVIKTGYPVLNIHVTYSGTSAITGTTNTLYSFTGGADGGHSSATLVEGTNGNLYGTTSTSGTGGAGTVFQITTSGSLTTLYSFTGGNDGGNPRAGLARGSDGNFYGVTETGGTGGTGTVFQITTSGSLTTLYSFTGSNDGGNPFGGLIQAGNSDFYGTTETGGTGGAGTVFQITSSGSLTTLYSFTGGNDGGNPYAGLVQGSSGDLYGTTETSGTGGAGTVFQITTSGSLATLYSFTGGADGGHPQAGLIEASGGKFLGTTETDGTGNAGTVFAVSTSGTLTTLHTFSGGKDGSNPRGALIQATNGDLYGTTETSGSTGAGTVFQISTSGSLTTIHTFSGGSDGGNPQAALVQGTDGFFYGTTETGGTNGFGTVFQLPTTGVSGFSGTMTFALLRDMAPITTGYIAGFAQAGYYNNTNFFRITNLNAGVSGQPATFIAQGGDPSETGTGSPGFSFNNEFNPSLIFTGQGQLAMANSGIDQNTFLGTNGAQFFITQNPLRFLDFNHTIFGQLIHGFDVMQKVMGVPLASDGQSPTVPVVMNSVTVAEDNTDAILLVSAAGSNSNGATIRVNATDPAGNKAVIVSGTTSTPGLSLNISTENDTVNDPPFIIPDANVSAPLHQTVSLPLKGRDLEFDFLETNAVAITNPTSATVSASGNVARVIPNPSSPVGSVTAGLYLHQPFASVLRSNPYDQSAVTVGLGSGRLSGNPLLFVATPNSPVSSSTAINISPATAFGSFLDSNPGRGPSSFTATINWGDGTAIASGTNTVSVSRSGYIPTSYQVSGPLHSYNGSGIFPINVTVTDTSGAVLAIQDTAVVSSGPIYPFGRTFTAPKGLANSLVAAFVDNSGNTFPSDYNAIINWGDGTIGNGVVEGSNGRYQVYGRHQYKGGSTYPVDVTINSTLTNNPGYAWSIASLTGVPTHQSPFAQSHVDGEMSNAGYGPGFVDEQVVLINSGNLPSAPLTLKFYLYPSFTAPTEAQLSASPPVPAGAIPLKVGGKDTYNTPSIAAGSSIAGVVSQIEIPAGAVRGGKSAYIIMEVVNPDPVGNHMHYPRAFYIPE